MIKISVLIVNYNSADFIGVSLYALNKLTKNPYRVFIIDNNSKKSDYEKLKKYTSKYDNVYLERVETALSGSLAHGTALNRLAKKIDTCYFSILDADALWLKKNWDEILIATLSDRIKATGTQAPELKPQDFPIMFAILAETESFKKMDIDFRPKNLEKNQDTGWEMREKYLKAGLSGFNIMKKSTRFNKNGPFGAIAGVDEFYLENDPAIFACHFGRGSNPLGKQIINFKSRLLRLLFLPMNFLLWHRDKRSWINTCRRIIDNQ
jgi:glycosyltransferase involved in cell wall biosynthesis